MRRIAAVQLAAHALAHRRHVGGQGHRVALAGEDLAAQGLEPGQQAGIPGQRPHPHQGLVLPGPGALALVAGIAGLVHHQQALRPVRAQAHVHLVEPAGGGGRVEQGHQLLGKPQVPARGIQGPRPVGDRGQRPAMHEDEVEVGRKAELLGPDAAVAEHGELAVGQAAMGALHLVAGEPQGGRQRGLGHAGEQAGGGHRIQAPGAPGKTDAEGQAVAALVQGQQGGLGILGHGRQRGELRGDALGLGQGAGGAHVEQLVEQLRLLGEALGEQGAVGTDRGQPLQRRRLLGQQGKVTAAPPDRAEQGDGAGQAGIRRLAGRRLGDQRRHDAIEPDSRPRREAAPQGRAGQAAQGLVGGRGIGEAGLRQHPGLAALRAGPASRPRAAPAAARRGGRFPARQRTPRPPPRGAPRARHRARRHRHSRARGRCAGGPGGRPAGHGSAHRAASAPGSPPGAGSGRPRPAAPRWRGRDARPRPAPPAPAASRAGAGPVRGRRGSAAGPAPGTPPRGYRRARA
ncbi:MAG: hypothetical protein KatS3mg127_1047 [Silanimonas sp.]|nr:MAG: hypothetical protein KatS3mg127_1047 [Silanimonas sp.]